MAKIIGIDFGTKRIGLALSDDGGTLAFPHSVISNDSKAMGVIKNLYESEGLERVVLGLPRGFDAQETAMTKQVRDFGAKLLDMGLPVVYEPEILSSQQASRAGGAKGMIDAAAAAIILQSFLDRQKDMLR